jgi:alkylhydroperoxidase family enzyme
MTSPMGEDDDRKARTSSDEDVNRFLAAGFGKDHLLEVVAAVAASTITNYTGSIAKPSFDVPFQAHDWAG